MEKIFNQLPLLQQALTTKGYAYEHQLDYDNQRLEFLGDAVMELIISEHLYQASELDEGELTRLRASAVCEASFAALARSMGLADQLKLASGQALLDSLLADGFEALMGALFLEHGYGRTKTLVESVIIPQMEFTLARDPKSELQERLQAKGIREIEYVTLGESGPDHCRSFEVGLLIQNEQVSRGTGRSKKEAQKAAAAAYLNML